MIINKRIFRDFKKNVWKYMALMLLVIIGLAIVVGLTGSVDSIEVSLKELHRENNLEDGNFSVAYPLEKEKIESLKKTGAFIEKSFCYDVKLKDEKTIRFVKNREKIDKFYLLNGRFPEKEDELFLEIHFAEEAHLQVGDYIKIEGDNYYISGLGIAPDYTTCLQSISDSAPAPGSFGIGVVAEDSLKKIERYAGLISTEYNYLFTLTGENKREEFRKKVENLEYLTSYLDIGDNPRVQQELKEIVSQRNISLVFGVFFICVMAYVLAVFTSGYMKNERETIGTFYAMGYRKKELIRHYIRMPMIVLLLSSLLGLAGGYFFIDLVVAEHEAYYDLPVVNSVLQPYQYIFTIILTLILGFLFNIVVIRKQLSVSPIELLKNRVKYHKMKHSAYRKRPFMRSFARRIIQSNKEGYLALTVGMILSVVLLVYGFCMYESLNKMPEDAVKGVHYEHQYILKLPENNDKYKKQKAMTISMNGKERINGESIPVQINGLEKDNDYFVFNRPENEKVAISASTAEKMGWTTGDTIKLIKQPENKVYKFEVGVIVEYTGGMNIFLDMDVLNKKLGYKQGSYNTVYSDTEMQFNAEELSSHNRKSDLMEASKGYIEAMKGTIDSLMMGSVVLFVLILFLMLKIVIEREAYHISLIKIMGYTDKEVSKLYFWNSFVIFLISMIVGFPVGKMIMNFVLPVTMAAMPVNVRVLLSPGYIGLMLAIMLAAYLIIGLFIRAKLKKVPYTVVLKSRD